MRIFRWLFALLGFLQRGPVFFRIWYAFVGYWIGSVIDSVLTPFFFGREHGAGGFDRYFRNDYKSTKENLLQALLTVFAHLIHADGRIMHSEMEYVRNFLRAQYGDDVQVHGEEVILRIFKEKKAMPEAQWERNVAIRCQLLAMYMPFSQRVQLLQILVQMARVDGTLAPVEHQALRFIATYLGLGAAIVEQLLGGTYSSSGSSSTGSLEEAYRTLGLSSSATDDEVRKAYRSMALKYHPDKFASKSETERKEAAAQFCRITEAKDRIYAARGMK